MLTKGLLSVLTVDRAKIKKWSTFIWYYLYLKRGSSVLEHCIKPNQRQNTWFTLRTVIKLLNFCTCVSGSFVSEKTPVTLVIITMSSWVLIFYAIGLKGFRSPVCCLAPSGGRHEMQFFESNFSLSASSTFCFIITTTASPKKDIRVARLAEADLVHHSFFASLEIVCFYDKRRRKMSLDTIMLHKTFSVF